MPLAAHFPKKICGNYSTIVFFRRYVDCALELICATLYFLICTILGTATPRLIDFVSVQTQPEEQSSTIHVRQKGEGSHYLRLNLTQSTLSILRIKREKTCNVCWIMAILGYASDRHVNLSCDRRIIKLGAFSYSIYRYRTVPGDPFNPGSCRQTYYRYVRYQYIVSLTPCHEHLAGRRTRILIPPGLIIKINLSGYRELKTPCARVVIDREFSGTHTFNLVQHIIFVIQDKKFAKKRGTSIVKKTQHRKFRAHRRIEYVPYA